MAFKQNNEIIAFVKKISSCNGAYRGIIQIPAHLGIVLALNSSGITGSQSVADTLFWVWAFPRFFSVPLELLGGLFSQIISSQGSFKCLPAGTAIRTVSLMLMMAACLSKNSDQILILGTLSVFMGEIGRALFTCQFQDVIKQTVQETKTENLNLISKCEAVEKNFLHIFRVIFAALGTASIVLFHIFRYEKYTLLFFLPFILSIAIHLIALNESISWSSIRSKSVRPKMELFKQTIPQIKHFFISRNIYWSLGAGGFIFLYIYLINFSAIRSDIFSSKNQAMNLNVHHAIYASILAILPPMAAWTSNLILLKKTYVKFKNLSQGYLGVFLLSLWFVFALMGEILNLSSSYRMIWVFSFAFLFGPLQTWIGWQRIPILTKAESDPNNSSLFQSSHVFYYTLISSSMELSIAIFGSFIKFAPTSQLNLALFLIGLGSIGLILIWKFNFEKYLTKRNMPNAIQS